MDTGNRSTIDITAESREEANELLNGLSEGEEIEPVADQAPGSYFEMLTDKYSIQWVVQF
jgi:PhnB protein